MKPFSVLGARINRNLCYIHNLWEWWFPWNYRACFECGHVWKTRYGFLKDVRAMDDGMREHCPWWQYSDPDAITACPLCTHDF